MNRARMARQTAGLSVMQAAKMLACWPSRLYAIELGHKVSDEELRKMADVYNVRIEWLLGEVDQRDYAAIDSMPGSANLTDHDRDIIAEFAAPMPRRTAP